MKSTKARAKHRTRPLAHAVALALAIALLGSLFACGQGSGSGGASSTQPPASQSSQPSEAASETSGATEGATESATTEGAAAGGSDLPTAEFVTVTYYQPKPIANIPPDVEDRVEAFFNAIIGEKLNASLDIIFIDPMAFDDRIRMMSVASEAYDLVTSSSEFNKTNLAVKNGTLMPLDELLDKYGPAIREKVDPRAWAANTFGGEIYSIPGQMPYAPPTAITFKKDLIDKYDVDFKAMDDIHKLEPYLKLIKENEPDITPLYRDPGTENYNATALIDTISYNELTGELMCDYDDEFMLESWRTLHKYYTLGYLLPDAVVRLDNDAEIKSAKFAVMRDSGGYDEEYVKASTQYGFPCVQTLYGYPRITTDRMTAAGTAVSVTSPNPERAMMINNLIWEDRFLSNTIAYGLEGEHYTVVKGDPHVWTDDTTVDPVTGDAQTWAVWHPRIGPLWEQWDSGWNSTAALQKMLYDNENAPASALVGFIVDLEPMKQEVAQLQALGKETVEVLKTGSMPDFDSYMENCRSRWKAAGGEAAMAELQRQIDAWKAENQ
jgi:putative aldouronate transport system substrate-binding protein